MNASFMIQAQENEGHSFDSFSDHLRPTYGVPSAQRSDTDTLSAWVNQAAILSDQSGVGSYFRNYLYPDSTVLVQFNNGMGPVWKHSFGQVLHPANSVWFSASGVSVADTALFTLDSVAIYYRYFRWNDSLPDTLVMQVWDDDGVNTSPDPGWQSGASYANVPYNYTQRKGSNPVMESTYILENKDTMGFDFQARIAMPVGLPFDTGRMAVTFTFFPGVPASDGDTIDVYNDLGDVQNKVNAFIVYEYRDEVPNVIAGDYNNGLVVTRGVRYNINTNGWNGSYQPGTAWASSSGTYHFDMDFKITYQVIEAPSDPGDPAGLTDAPRTGIHLFPNPTNDWLQIENGTGKPFDLTIYDMQGRVVTQHPTLGVIQRLNLHSLPSGVYTVHMRSETQVYRERIVVK